MSFSSDSGQPRILLAACCFGCLLGGLILCSAVWHLVVVVLSVSRHLGSPGAWLQVTATLVLVALSVTGGAALLRARLSGYFPLYLAGCAALLPWGFPLLPFVAGWLAAGLAGGSPIRPLNEVQLVNLLVLLLLVVSHLTVRKLAPATPCWPTWLYPRRIAATLALAGLFGVWLFGHRLLDQKSGERVKRGVELFESGEDVEALEEWGQAIAQYPHTSNWGAAVYNCGWLHQQRQRYAQAIPFYERLLDSGLDDHDSNGSLMSPYRNYHHRACLGLSECHEGLGDSAEALRYARLAQDTYPFQSWCGTCRHFESLALRERIERLEQALPANARQPGTDGYKRMGGEARKTSDVAEEP